MSKRNALFELPKRAQVWLSLSEDDGQTAEPAPWIGSLLALGARAARYVDENRDRQLVIALSVPTRDFAAVLVGCGWVMASKPPKLQSPLDTLRSMEPGIPIRAVNDRNVVTGTFTSLNESISQPRAQFAGSTWQVSEIRALARVSEVEEPARMIRPRLGNVGRMSELGKDWEAHLAAPAADLAIVGTLTWLQQDFNASLSRENEESSPQSIRDVLLPKLGHVATWFTRVYSSARLADDLPLSSEVRSVVLDGNAAIKYLAEIESQVVICVIDRSVADESASELIVQMRNSRGKAVSISNDLGWPPPAGIEALAFTVAL